MLGKNIIANYFSQAYVTLIGLALLPLYIKYMGSEAYGLVGFFSMLQAWFALLDLGLTPTISRESARYYGGATSALAYRQLYRALSIIFFSIAVIGCVALYLSSATIAKNWLTVVSLSMFEVVISLKIMAACIALRWMCGLYRGVITGGEKFVWLSGFNVIIATLRFLGVIISMYIWGFTPIVFFIHQLIIALIEIIVFSLKSTSLLPKKNTLTTAIGWSFKPIKPVLKFSLTIAFTAGVWVTVTQSDKLILSGILTLEDYGYFTLAVLIANGIMILSGPISSAILPRMSRLFAENKLDDLIQLYKNSTQYVVIISGSVSITMAAISYHLIYAWTGDPAIAEEVAPILRLYAIGNGFLSIAAFPYYLQYARGTLKYHFIGNILMLLFLLPAIILSSIYFGAIGAGYAWIVMNGLYLVFWVAYVHKKLQPGLHNMWMLKDVIAVLALSIIIGTGVGLVPYEISGRLANLLYSLVIGFIILVCAILSASTTRTMMFNRIEKMFK